MIKTGILTCMFFVFIPISALAQSTKLPASYYGMDVFPVRESLGDSVLRIKKHGNTFEPLNQFREDDPLRVITRAIGRLDMLVEKEGKRFVTTCTGSLVNKNHILTNHHCIPGISGKVLKASVLFDYLHADGSRSKRVEIIPRELESDARLDYALVKLSKSAPDTIKPLRLVPKKILPNTRLILIHHPAGQIKVMTRFLCKSANSTPENSVMVRHVCDSLPGSSGGILFDHKMNAVAVHHSGGLNKNDAGSFNSGTLASGLLFNRPTLLGSTPGLSAKSTGTVPGSAVLSDKSRNLPAREMSPLEKDLESINSILE